MPTTINDLPVEILAQIFGHFDAVVEESEPRETHTLMALVEKHIKHTQKGIHQTDLRNVLLVGPKDPIDMTLFQAMRVCKHWGGIVVAGAFKTQQEAVEESLIKKLWRLQKLESGLTFWRQAQIDEECRIEVQEALLTLMPWLIGFFE